MKKNKREELLGIPPDELAIVTTNKDYFTVYKTSKKGTKSFRITEALIDSLLLLSNKIQKQPKLVITIPVGPDEYEITCTIIKK